MKAAIQKDSTGMIADWSTALVNHMYWVAASTPTSTPQWSSVVESKWRSTINHVVNKHSHNDPNYSRCDHPRRQKGQKKKYMKAGGETHGDV